MSVVSSLKGRLPGIFELQKPVVGGKGLLNQVPPVQNTWYTVLDTADLNYQNIEVNSIQVFQTNDETGAKTCQMRVTISGVLISSALGTSLNHSTDYYCNFFGSADGQVLFDYFLSSGVSVLEGGQSLKGRDVQLEIRMTSAPGTNQVLKCAVVFHRLVGL